MVVEIVNTDQEAAWNGHEGQVWTEEADRYDRASRRILHRFAEAGVIEAGDAVLDVGCGTGAPTRTAARASAPGPLLGLDLSTRMLDLARRRSADEGLTNVTFERGDAQVFAFEPEAFDIAMSSFGAMFFGDPVAAFTNIGRAVRPGGRLALLAWRTLPENDWLTGLRGALAMGRDLPVPPPEAPTPFSLADADRVRQLLGAAGFVAVDLTPIDEPMDLGDDVDDAMAFASTMGIVEGLTHDLDADHRAEAMANVADLMAAHETADGVLIGSAAWLITAQRA
jgi:SAM-dependent methyltransferase